MDKEWKNLNKWLGQHFLLKKCFIKKVLSFYKIKIKVQMCSLNFGIVWLDYKSILIKCAKNVKCYFLAFLAP